jgi:hypothetical protein
MTTLTSNLIRLSNSNPICLTVLILLLFTRCSKGLQVVSYKDPMVRIARGKILVENRDIDKYIGRYTTFFEGKTLIFDFEKVLVEIPSKKAVFIHQYLTATRYISENGIKMSIPDLEFKLQCGSNLPEDVNRVKFFIPNSRGALIVYDLIYIDSIHLILKQGHSESGPNVMLPDERSRAYLPISIKLTKN